MQIENECWVKKADEYGISSEKGCWYMIKYSSATAVFIFCSCFIQLKISEYLVSTGNFVRESNETL